MHTLSNGTHAPQFGFMRSADVRDEPEKRTTENRHTSVPVVVKRRRVLENPPESPEVQPAAEAPVRAPKIFQVTHPVLEQPRKARASEDASLPELAAMATGDRMPAVNAAEQAEDVASAVAPRVEDLFTDSTVARAPRKPQRRMSEVEKPVLIQHVVFETTVAEDAELADQLTELVRAQEAEGVDDFDTFMARAKATKKALRGISEGLTELTKLVAEAQRAQELSTQLDALLQRAKQKPAQEQTATNR